MPEGAGVEYNKVTKMIMVTSADDVATLATFFLDALPARGWQVGANPLVTDNSAILKFARGGATLTRNQLNPRKWLTWYLESCAE